MVLDSYIEGLFGAPIELQAVLDAIPVGLCILDADRRLVLLNRKMEGLTGFSNSEARGIPCRYILRTGLCHDKCPAQRLLEDDGPLETDSDIINRGRQKIRCKIITHKLRSADGRHLGYVELVEDVSHESDGHADGNFMLFQGKLIGAGLEMQRVFRVLPAIAQTDSSVLITGETGTGKDFVAEALHQASVRSNGPFIKVNCGALPETLLESELFGHEKGAFTGAVEQKPGRFRLAHMGSLYLTEIGDLPLTLQVKLLSFLDDRMVYPLGGAKAIHVDVRVIAATHRNLEQMSREGKFRQDLFFRLNVVRLHLPPLCRRGGDVKMLMDHFLQVFNSRFTKQVGGFSSRAEKALLLYNYPGNVRELRNIVEYSVNICNETTIHERHLPKYVVEACAAGISEPCCDDPSAAVQPAPMFEPSQQTAAGVSNWQEAERKLILDAMIKVRGKRDEAARLLGMGRSTLWRKMKKYGIA